MKRFIFSLILLLTTCIAFAQTPQHIEADLLKSFKKIDYWSSRKYRDDVAADDSLYLANQTFGKKLKHYAEKYSFTASMTFKSLKTEGVEIATSANGRLRIYSWNTQLGGTMRRYGNVFQYNTADGYKADLIVYNEQDIGTYFSKIYTVKAGQKIYYLGFSTAILSSAYYTDVMAVFAIEDGRLKKDIKIIKTDKGLTDNLFAEYDFSAAVNRDVRNTPRLSFDRKSKTIHLPLILENQKITGKYVDYKFNGSYFEKVKN